ncbi:MAG: hypothetical protein DMG06_06130 [Acidobacteria bacterium]|nr:MAG: hypothetical protein DMG06_06130 [Acidobacteriota bacterium]
MHRKLLSFFRLLFLASILISAGFLSCLTAMRLAIRGSEVTVPDLVGKTIHEGVRQISLSGLRLKVESHRFDERVATDLVISQSPSPYSKLKRSRNVRVIVSLGAKKVQVPDLKGESLRASQIALLERGLTLGAVSSVHSESIEMDKIISQDPLPQTRLAQSPLVNLLVSTGRKSREYLMPELTGSNLEEVSKILEVSGLKLGAVSYHPLPGLLRGTIFRQNPPPGYKLVEGSSIDLEVCR